MPVFVVVLNRHSEKVIPTIEDLPEGTTYKIKDDAWLIDHKGTTRELAEKLGIRGSDASGATGIAFPITNYSGRAPGDAWEWLKLHMMEQGD